MDDVGADVVQERLVVRDDEEGLLPVLEVVVQPDDGVQVEVVRRFVEHEERGLDEERSSQRDTHPPAAGKLVGRPVLHLAAEAETGQQSSGLGFRLKS